MEGDQLLRERERGRERERERERWLMNSLSIDVLNICLNVISLYAFSSSDGEKVTEEDLGNNFFVESGRLGESR